MDKNAEKHQDGKGEDSILEALGCPTNPDLGGKGMDIGQEYRIFVIEMKEAFWGADDDYRY